MIREIVKGSTKRAEEAMPALQPVRGTRDILPEEMLRHRHVEQTAFEIAARYGFAEISTPIFEFTEVFSRTLGDTSDIVTKEMYAFEDRSGDSITLRPECTAGVARAVMSNGLAQHLPLKFFCRGPMFRYERRVMPALQPVRGTRDILPEEMLRHRHVEQTAFEIAARYGFAEISTPIFEFTEVFSRTLGDTSDIVTKEMYAFEDRSGDSITLRPECTAGVARAVLSNGLAQHLPLKFFCRGPMFRYERPQKGRQRQFHQVDVEVLGVAQPLADVEIIALGAHILEALGVSEKVTLELNTLGDGESRHAYRKILVEYLEEHRDRLSDDSLSRLERNPLRIFDSKDKGDRAVVAGAPLLTDSLNGASREFLSLESRRRWG